MARSYPCPFAVNRSIQCLSATTPTYRYAASEHNNDPPFPDHFFAVQMDFVYQLTNRDRCKLFMESVDPNDPLGITPPVGAGHARDD